MISIRKYSDWPHIILSLVILLSFIMTLAISPPILNAEDSDWITIYIKGVGSINIPPTMEVQEGKYLQYQNEIYKRMEYDTPQLVIQQSGLNEFKESSFNSYSRIIILTEYGRVGEFERINFNISTYNKAEIKQTSNLFKKQIEQSFFGTGLKLIRYFPLRLETINGMSCLHISYIRQFKDNPYVKVDIYQFHNYDRMHELTLSYRIDDNKLWEDDFNKILVSFKLLNKR